MYFRNLFIFTFCLMLVSCTGQVVNQNTVTPRGASNLWFPAQKGIQLQIAQGNHNGATGYVYALDFARPDWTSWRIFPVSAGTVVATVNNRDNCSWTGNWQACDQIYGQSGYFGNFVKILNDDGTYAVYGHFVKGSIVVQTGDPVKLGSPLGDAGNTGDVIGQVGGAIHLHLEIRNSGSLNGASQEPGYPGSSMIPGTFNETANWPQSGMYTSQNPGTVTTPPDQPPSGYTKCADEGGTCNITTKSNVVFGAQTSWTTPREFTSSTPCNVATFGDPIQFVRKSCYSKPVGTTPPPPNQPPSNARLCATEGNRCNFSGSYDVWYGNNTTWVARSYNGGVDCKTENFGGTDPLPGVQKVCKTLGPDASPPPPTGQQIRKARSNNQVMDWDGGSLKLWTSVPNEGNQFFIWEDHIRGDKVLRNTKYNTCLEFPDGRTQNMKASFVGCNKDDPHQQIIYDRGNYLGYNNGVHEWNIRPRGDANWCLSVNGSDTQGTEIVWQRDSCDQPQRRWVYDGISPPARWAPNPSTLVLPSGVMSGSGASADFTLVNNGGTGSYKITSSNAYFAISPANGALSAGTSTSIGISAGACPSAGTQTGVVTIQESDSTATVNVTRTCDPAPTSWSLNPASLTLPEGAVGDGMAASGTFAIINNGGAGNYNLTSSNTNFTVNPASGLLGTGGSASITVSTGACTAFGVTSSSINISGGGSNIILNVSRFCNNPLAPPATPTDLQVTMSSEGRIFVAWQEQNSATYYEFKATFDGQDVSVSGQAPAQSNPTAGAVATFLTTPDAADKQGKPVCLAVRAVNTGGSSAYTSLGCALYKYYTMAALTRTGQDDKPRLTINR